MCNVDQPATKDLPARGLKPMCEKCFGYYKQEGTEKHWHQHCLHCQKDHYVNEKGDCMPHGTDGGHKCPEGFH